VFRECAEPKGTFGFCSIHDPVVVADKRAAKEAQWRREWDERDARIKALDARKAAIERCVAVLREIAAGHNDPRSVARDALNALDAIAGETEGRDTK
jgi:hypothetical protein